MTDPNDPEGSPAEDAPASPAAGDAAGSPAADDAPASPEAKGAATASPAAKGAATASPAAGGPVSVSHGAPPPPDLVERAGAWLVEHGAPLALLAITIAVFLIHMHIFAGETAGDDLSFHFAEARRLADCLRHGDLDFWNPSANAGYASGYYYQVLPQLASAIPAAIFGHLLFWFQLSVVVPLVLAPACAYRGMRMMGATPWQSALAAFAIAFMNGQSRWGAGNAGTFQVGLYTQTWALCFFPLALGHGARWISEGKGLPSAVAWGGLVGLTHPFMVIVLGLAFTVALLAPLVPRLDRLAWPSVVGRALLMLGLAVMLIVPPVFFGPAKGAFKPSWHLTTVIPVAIGAVMLVAGFVLPIALRPPGVRWVRPDVARFGVETPRWLALGVLMVIAFLPVAVPLLADYSGFGGFPHRVGDEVGPGFFQLATWFRSGMILDWTTIGHDTRFALLTLSLPVLILFVRSKLLRWMWPAALFYGLLLGMGPHMGKIGDDLFPAVRALGAMQTLLALGIGAGAIILGKRMWEALDGTPAATLTRVGLALGVIFAGAELVLYLHAQSSHVMRIFAWTIVPLALAAVIATFIASRVDYTRRTLLAAAGAALLVFVAIPGTRALSLRVRVLTDLPNNHRGEMREINATLAKQPQGRKQVGPGAVNHWWNLLSYAYYRVPSLLQMGGGGLQASPNYDFLWSEHDFLKNAWVYDAPYLVFERSRGQHMPEGETILRTPHYELRKLPSPGLVSPVQITGVLPAGARTGEPGHTAALKWIKGGEPMQDHLLAYAGYGPPGPPPDGRTLRAWRQDSPGDQADIVAEVEAKQPSTFVIRVSWHPRWHAYIDGNEVPVRRVTPDFPAVNVPVGKHTLELRFERPWWTLAVWLLWPGAAMAAWWWTRKRMKSPKLPEARAVAG